MENNATAAVMSALMASEEARDSDRALLTSVWAKEVGENKAKKTSFWDFMQMFYLGEVSNPESITRCRRKLQELYPELRGKKWSARHKMAELVRFA